MEVWTTIKYGDQRFKHFINAGTSHSHSADFGILNEVRSMANEEPITENVKRASEPYKQHGKSIIAAASRQEPPNIYKIDRYVDEDVCRDVINSMQ